MGDERTYEETCVLRSINSVDGMTADVTNIDVSILSEVATLIVNKVPRVNKVLYDITSKPPSTIEWEWPRNFDSFQIRLSGYFSFN